MRKFDEIWLKVQGPIGAKARQSSRSRQELSNEYFLAKFGFDTAENEPLKVCQKLAKVRKKYINIAEHRRAIFSRVSSGGGYFQHFEWIRRIWSLLASSGRPT